MVFERLEKFTSPRYAILIFIIFGFAVYAGALTANFLWDDFPLLINNPMVHSFGVFLPNFFFSYAPFYRPVPDIFYTGLFQLFGPLPFPFHLFQVVAHIGVVISAYFLFRKHLSDAISFALAFLFLVHPINVDAVTNTQSHQVTLSALFGIWALLLLYKEKLSTGRIFAVLGLLLLSVFSKESGLAFLFAAPLIPLFRSGIFSRLLVLGEGLIASIFLASRTFIDFPEASNPHFYDRFGMMNATFLERMSSVPKMIAYYAHMLLYPDRMSIWQNWVVKNLTFADFYLPLIICGILGAALIAPLWYLYTRKSEHWRPYLIYLVLFIFALAPHMQIYPLDMTVWDRWMYVPLIALLLMAGLLAQYVQQHQLLSIRGWGIAILAAILICSALAARTVTRNGDWQDDLTLYEHDAQYNDTNAALYSNYGFVLSVTNQREEAEKVLLRAIELAPTYWTAYSNLGYTYYQEGKPKEAADAYLEAMRLGGGNVDVYQGLGRSLLKLPDTKKAVGFLEDAVKQYPKDAMLWDYLSVAYYKDGQGKKSQQAVQKARDVRKFEVSPLFYGRYTQEQVGFPH